MVVGAGVSAIVEDVLLGAGVASALICVLGVIVMRTTLDRLHYSAAATTVPAFLILGAVLVRERLTSGGLEAIAAVALMFLLNPVLLTTTGRATRRIDQGDVRARPEEKTSE
jgi:multisubunit Na+/H+ antiporter MnhG subunit